MTVPNPAGDPVLAAREDFRRFVTTWHPADVVEETQVSLEELLAAWLYAGAGIEATAGDYGHFLSVVLLIVDGVLKGTVDLDYAGGECAPFPRRMAGLTNPRLGGNVLTRMGFDQLVRQTTEERRAEELTAKLRRALGPRSGPRVPDSSG